jgi:hypothetical protein
LLFSESCLSFGFAAIMPCEPFLHEAYGDLFGSDRNRSGRSGISLSQASPNEARFEPSQHQRQEADRAAEAESAAALRLAKTKPRTPAGAATALAYIVNEMDQMHGQVDWHMAAIETIAAALRTM